MELKLRTLTCSLSRRSDILIFLQINGEYYEIKLQVYVQLITNLEHNITLRMDSYMIWKLFSYVHHEVPFVYIQCIYICMQQLTFFHYVNGIFSKLVPLINPISDKNCSARSSLTDKTYSYVFIYMNIDYITL